MDMDIVPEIVFQGEGFHIESYVYAGTNEYALRIRFVREPDFEAFQRLRPRETTLFAPRPRNHVYDGFVDMLKAKGRLIVKEQEAIDARNRRLAIDVWTRFLVCVPSMRVTWKSRIYKQRPMNFNALYKEFFETQIIINGCRNPRIIESTSRLRIEVDTEEFGVFEVDMSDQGRISPADYMVDDVCISMDPLPPPETCSLALLAKRQIAEDIVDGRVTNLQPVLKEALGLFYLPPREKRAREEGDRDDDEPEQKKARFCAD